MVGLDHRGWQGQLGSVLTHKSIFNVRANQSPDGAPVRPLTAFAYTPGRIPPQTSDRLRKIRI